MSQPDHDQTIHWINEATASMGGTSNGAEPGQIVPQNDQVSGPMIEIQGIPGVALEEDGLSAYSGIADELLLEAGRLVPPEIRDELARHIGSGIVNSLLAHPSTERDLASITDGVLLEARIGLQSGDLLRELKEIVDFTTDATATAGMGMIARWRHSRRLAAEQAALAAQEAAAAAQRYKERQNELKRTRVGTLEGGYISTASFKPGDEVAFDMKTQSHDSFGPKATLRLTVVGYEEGQNGQPVGVQCTVTEEHRSGQKLFQHEPLPAGANVTIRCSAYTANDYIRHPGRVSKNETLVVMWEGQRMPLDTLFKWQTHSGGLQQEIEPMHVEQLTINEVKMFSEDK